MKKSQNTPSLLDIALSLESDNILTIKDVHSTKCIVVESNHSWTKLAHLGSVLGDGKWLHRKSGACQLKGRGTGWFLSPSGWEQVEKAQSICKELVGESGGYSVASNARKMWGWALRNEEKYFEKPDIQSILDGRKIGYHTCTPGEYENVTHFDLKGCYPHMLWRLKSRKWRQICPGTWVPRMETPDERERLWDLRQAVDEFKLLRNSLWGCALGSIDGGWAFEGGNRVTTPSYRGPSQTAALLVARMAIEMCQAATIETDGLYAATDSVFSPHDSPPSCWKSRGLPFDSKGTGPLDARYRHSYKFKNEPVGHYREKERMRVFTPVGTLPDRLFVNEFLC